jgi:hypothetical protein
MIDSMFQAGTDAALNDQVRRPAAPKPPAAPGFSFMDLVKAPFQGLGGAGANAIAFGAEITGAFGDVLGATGTAGAGGMFGGQTDKEKADSEAARRKLLNQGASYSNEAGDTFRRRAADIMPDPNTTHTSAQVVAGLAQFGAQAIGYGLTLGPAAPLALAGDVGLTESDRLKQQGVDLATRTKAGAVAGAVAGVSVVVPMTGATAVTRALKGVAVGEGSMVGQSAAERAILKAGGYDKIADSFDPLDPVALGMGLVPGALGAKFGGPRAKPGAEPPRSLNAMGLTERQALPYNDVKLDAYAVQAAQREGIPPEVLLAVKNAGEKSAPTATSPAGAQGVMQFMPATWKEFGRGDPTDPVNSIDAGARYLRKLHDAYGNWDAAVAHYNGGGAQAAIVRGGGVPTIPETAAYLKRVNAYLGKTVDEHVAAAVDAQPDLVPAARVGQAAAALEASRLTAADDLPGRDAHVRAVETAADQLGRGEPVRVDEIVGPAIDAGSGEPLSLFHGTQHPTAAFDELSAVGSRDFAALGAHFTTSEETARLFAGENGRVLRGVKRFSKSIEIPDQGTWAPWDVGRAIDEARGIKSDGDMSPLEKKLWDLNESERLNALDSEPEHIQELRNKFNKTPEERAQMTAALERSTKKGADAATAAIKAHLHEQGFDSIKYKNMYEGEPVDTYIDIGKPPVGFTKTPAGLASALDELHAASQPAEPPARNAPPTTQAPNPEAATPARGAGEPATPRQPTPSRAQPAIDAARQAHADMEDSGKPLAQFLADSTHPPEVRNLLLGMDRAKDDASRARLLSDFEAAARNDSTTPLHDLAADAVEGMNGKNAAPQAMLDRAAAEVSILNPDMLVQLDGMDAPVKVGELLARVKEEAANDAHDARLVEVAAACALRA